MKPEEKKSLIITFVLIMACWIIVGYYILKLAKMTNPFGWAVIFGVGAVSGYLYLRWDSWRDRLFEFLKLMRALNRSYPNPDEQTY